ncbi:MAG TPA: phospholipid carrier-dependent glycosyltransferase [Chthoniobacteraceae bacterium]
MNPPLAVPTESWRLLGWSLLLLGLCLAVFSRHNEFPYHYHPDEPGKVEQIIEGKWNFHHPMLLLAATKAVVETADVPRMEQPVVIAGRWVSATFMSVAVVALSLLAYAWRGWPAAFASGATLALHHQLYELAHYLKEDSALLAGIALSFLMLLACWWRPSPARVALLGVACGLALSGKYLGAVTIGLALPVLWRIAPEEARRSRVAIYFAALLLTLLLVNFPILQQLALFQESFGREMDSVVKGQRGLTRSVPHAQYWNVFIDNTTPAIWALLAVFLHARWRERRELALPEWLVIAFPFAYALALSFSPKSNDRYFLPATAAFTLFAALATMDFGQFFRRGRNRRLAIFGSAAVLVLGQIPSWFRYEVAFQKDDTAELIAWLNELVPADAVIAKDNRVQLPDPKKKKHAERLGVVPQKVIAERFAADVSIELLKERGVRGLGTIEELRSLGVTHVAVSESDYGRFFLKGLRPQKDGREDFDRRKIFYERLLRDGNPIFERDRGTVIYLHPGIRVYRLADLPAYPAAGPL